MLTIIKENVLLIIKVKAPNGGTGGTRGQPFPPCFFSLRTIYADSLCRLRNISYFCNTFLKITNTQSRRATAYHGPQITMKKQLLLLFLALLPLFASAYDAEIDGIYYNFSGGKASVTYRDLYNNSYSGSVSIPSSVSYNGKTYSVTSIGVYAFYDCKGLTSIDIPNSVTRE